MKKLFALVTVLILTSIICASTTFAQIGNNLSFEGDGNYAWAPDSASLDILGSQLTMEAWVKLSGPTGNHWIISKQNIDFNRSYGFYISNAFQTVVPSIHTTSGHFEDEVGNTILQYGVWYHVAVVYDGIKITTYIDGEFNGEADLTGNLLDNQKELTVGGTYWNTEDSLNGSIDEVRIWDIVRSQGDIQNTMNATLVGDEPGLVSYYRFEALEDLGIGGDGEDDYRDYNSLNSNHLDLFHDPYSCGDYNRDGVVNRKDTRDKFKDLMKEYKNWFRDCWLPEKRNR